MNRASTLNKLFASNMRGFFFKIWPNSSTVFLKRKYVTGMFIDSLESVCT